ncbi:MAG TPA: VCBS repeat-containing protein [Nitrospirota bacterium]|nr:VCBS repeat-containing protein [Nitrospirota bacterium]
MKNFFILIALVLSFGSVGAAAEKPLGVEDITSIEEIANDIASYFPKVQGEVEAVQGDRLTIGLGTKNGLLPGVTLTLWRDGKEIHHPVTGQVLGFAEDEVGSVDVIDVADTTCTAVLQEKLKDPKVGDKARITPKKISLALLPVREDHPEIIQGLQDRLSDLGRFSVLGNDKVAAFLKDRKQRDSSLIKELSKAYNLDVIVAFGIYPSEGKKLLVTAKLFYADEARPLDTVVAILDLKSKNDVFGEVKPFFSPVKMEADLPELPFSARFMVAADLEGNGTLRYVFSDGGKLYIYEKEPVGWREEWTEPISPGGGDIQHINLDVGDINGNGRPEIFVTAMQNGKVISYVLEFRDGEYHRIAEIPGFVRVITYPGKGALLLGQDYNPRTFFSGQIRQYSWENGKYVAGPVFALPRGVKLYGFVFATVGEADPLLMALDDKDHILVYSKDAVIWKSEETYPAVGIKVNKTAVDPTAVVSESVSEAEKSQKVRITGRIAALDVNGDGIDEIVLPKNSGGSFFSGYTQAEFVSLQWTGSRLEQRWSIKDIGGAVLDFQIRQQVGSGAQILALVSSSGGLLSSDHIRVMGYAAK